MSEVGQSCRSRQDGDLRLTERCLTWSRQRFPGAIVALAPYQGGCSITVMITSSAGDGKKVVVQFRPLQFALDLSVAIQARLIYGDLVPAVEVPDGRYRLAEGYQVVVMAALPGVPYSQLVLGASTLTPICLTRLERLIDDLAVVLARGWTSSFVATCTGRVGSSLRSRLLTLSRELPCSNLRYLAEHVLGRIEHGELECLPVVLSHGDLLPSNMLVNAETGALTGLIDWAEAEWLPFGVCLYGLDHLLGSMEVCGSPRFQYFANAASLRARFWARLMSELPVLQNGELLHSVQLARTIGVLLWHGFAWDDGRIDRIVNDKDDAEEVARLQAFLSEEMRVCRLSRL